MKCTLAILALTMLPVFSHAAPTLTSAQKVEAEAVVNSKEIKALLATEMKFRHLACNKVTINDVLITPDADMDGFAITYVCNDPKYGANVQRIDFSGGVYTASPNSTTAEVVLTGLQVEMSE